MSDLSHVDESTGDVHMVDVGDKPLSRRRAVARGRLRMAAATAARLRALPKGDALAVAGLTVYDMAKAIDKEMRLDEIVLVSKTKDPA